MRAHTRFPVVGLLAALLLAPGLAAAETLTFQLSVREVLASVSRYNAFLAGLGTRARGAKLVPGGTRFAGQTCAALGDAYRLGAVTVLDGPGALPALVTSRRGRDAAALASVLGIAGVVTWVPPAVEADTSLQFWTASPVPRGVRFAAEGLANDTDAGLLGAAGGAGILRFRANVPTASGSGLRYRFLLELLGRTPAAEGGLVLFAERRCFTFVDLEPVDLSALARLVDARVSSGQVRQALRSRLAAIDLALARRDRALALDTLAVFLGHLIGRTPELVPPDVARAVAATTFQVRRGLEFRPASAVCGNGTRETGEACDGADLGGFDCSNVGFASGVLACAADCRLDLSACVANPRCGNGILEVGEECDNGGANSDTLPDACRTTCRRASCGDGVIDVFEDCERGDLAGETCQTLGYDGGSLRCDTEFCEFDDSRCSDRE